MPPHIVALRRAQGVPPSLTLRGLGLTFGYRRREEAYKLIEDPDIATKLEEYETSGGVRCFRSLTGDEVADVLDSASEAVEVITAGEYDDVLDLLLVAERRAYDNRVTVIDAIADRRRALIEQRSEDDAGPAPRLTPDEVAPGRIR